jgi:hypothetical protein
LERKAAAQQRLKELVASAKQEEEDNMGDLSAIHGIG